MGLLERLFGDIYQRIYLENDENSNCEKYFPDIKIYSFEPQLNELNIQKKILGKKKYKLL